MSRKQLARSGGDLTRLGTDDAGATMLHLDMDSFFVSVELLTRPELTGRPVIVGGRSGRGVVVSASYEAREFGVHAAMPMARAIGLCPIAEVIPPSHGLYSSYSRRVFDLVAEVTPDVHQVSVDEAYIDVSGAVRRLGSPVRITSMLRERIAETTGLSASVGIAGSRVVAKLASARAKPAGQLLVPLSSTRAFLDPMPIEALPGVGEKTQEGFAKYGIRTIGDLAALDEHWVGRVFGAHGHHLWLSAHGRDVHGWDRQTKERSISAEHTFGSDVWDVEELEHELLRLADKVAHRVRAEGKVATSLGLKYRLSDFTTLSRSVTLSAPTDLAIEIYEALRPALRSLRESRAKGVRLLGVRAAGLMDFSVSGRQARLDEPERSNREAEMALDDVRRKFGTAAISQASLLRRPASDD
ncbi:DNA polymerase-4 [Brevibacterium sanguinis]|uniref:DNA polymerase IV n=2 Tax=Brevibacterium TaxID=1696 RepID=A0A366IF22_9MICO|nr:MULTISPECIES: DNA polymerase IV [Brevibacterium]RBP61918.1 DNA polymerase-4 [Brevibacterium sanguinis]RBP68636.1 DNA polymerase-4 [Brevibacterium celere]